MSGHSGTITKHLSKSTGREAGKVRLGSGFLNAVSLFAQEADRSRNGGESQEVGRQTAKRKGGDRLKLQIHVPRELLPPPGPTLSSSQDILHPDSPSRYMPIRGLIH